jgi:N-terminal acetyltransferase B complex non-catalytic subunit
MVDHIISAYRYGSFDKIREFIKLRERLSVSQHYTVITVERMILDVLVGGSNLHAQTVQMMSFLEVDPDKDDITWKELTDNRDFKTMASFDPAEK